MLRRLRSSLLVTSLAIASLLAPIAAPVHAAGIIRITEAMSNSLVTNTTGVFNGDWFELTNYGDASVDITGWKVDDNSFSFGSSLALNGITSIAANESVMFTENAGGVSVGDFKTFWGLGSNVQVGYYSGSGIGLSSAGDGVVIYTSGGTEINRVSFGTATANKSFYWSYDNTGMLGTTANGTLSVSGTGGAYTTSAGGANANVGSPGSAVVASIPNLYWTANGSALGGSGTWNTAGSNWSASASSVSGGTWADGKTAFFQGTAGTVTLTSAVAGGGVTFSTTGYTLASSGSGSLNVPTIDVTTAGDTATVSARVVGSGGLAKGGNGLLIVSNTANSYSGATSVVSGTMQSGAANVIPDASQLAAARFAAYDFNGNADTVGGISGLGSIVNIGGLTVNVTGASDVRFDGTLSGTGNFIVDSSGSGRQVFNSTTQTEADGAAKSYTGATIVRSGVLAIANGLNRVPNATSGVEIQTNGRLELTSANATYTIGAGPSTVVTLKGGSIGQEQDEDVTLANAVNVATSSAIYIKNTTTPVVPATTEEVTLSGVLTGSAGTILSLTASNQTPGADAGRVLFTNATGNSYAGTVSVGQNMNGRFNGDYSTTAVLLNGGGIEGNGSVKSIGGLGTVSPGTSPGILTAESVDAASGIDFAFEFSATGAPTYNAAAASVNDVLRLTSNTPLTGTINGANVIDLFLGVTSLAQNDAFQGGFFTLSDQTSALAGAAFQAWIKGDGLGTDITFNGQGYYSLASYNTLVGGTPLSIAFGMVATTADFGAGSVNGYVGQITAVPEPGSLLLAACGLAVLAWQHRRRIIRVSAPGDLPVTTAA
ncbi:MAG: lamin tail domain-containing protein [Planctomycetia bacterium]